MKNITRSFVAALIGFLAVVVAAASTQHAQVNMRGQIIAYRPAERVSQAASHALNRESFLFRSGPTKSSPQLVVTKLVYEHFGYSDLGSDLLDKAPRLVLKVHRDARCDETYRAFVQNSPTLKEEQSKDETGEKVVFIEPFRTMKLSPDQTLKCYKLQSGNFQIEPSQPGH
jgi:hypothetical protein